MLEHVTTSYKASDGSVIFAQYWKPDSPKAVVIQVHGLGEHSGRYGHVAEAFAARGYAMLAYDHTGHGQSSGPRGHVPGYMRLMDELDLAMGKAATVFPGLPVIIYGHSWGGNIALNFIIRRKPKVAGALITGPWLKLPTEPPAIQVALGKLVKGIFPAFAQNTGLKAEHLSHDPAVNEAYVKDPLVHSKISAQNFFESSEAADYALHRASSYSTPTLLMHGGDDQITSVEGSLKFAAKSKSAILKVWPGLYHEIHNEPQKAEVFAAMLDFMDNCL